MNCFNEVQGYQENVHIIATIMQTQKKPLREEKISEYDPFLRKCSEMSGDKGCEGCSGGQDTRLNFHSKDSCATTSGGCAGV